MMPLFKLLSVQDRILATSRSTLSVFASQTGRIAQASFCPFCSNAILNSTHAWRVDHSAS